MNDIDRYKKEWSKRELPDFIVLGILAVITVAFMLFATSCNDQSTDFPDFPPQFNYAYIQLPNGEVVSGRIDNYNMYSYGQLRVTIDGNMYMVHSSDCVLVYYKDM